MEQTIGISIYTTDGFFRIRSKLMKAINIEDYIHLYFDTKNKLLYIQACDKDKDAFKLVHIRSMHFVKAKLITSYVARISGVSVGKSYWYVANIIDDRTAVVDLKLVNEYE